jgi:methionyl-tRNA formyltransferase
VTDQVRIVFMGSPDFAVPVLDALARNYPLVGVVTQPDRPAGRGGKPHPPAVKKSAVRLNIPYIQPEKLRHPEAMNQLHAWRPDLIVVAAFGQILRQEVLDMAPYGCINVHGSLLPRWRGAAPIQASILASDTETGITIMKMDAGVDTGPILSQRAIAIAPKDTGGSLFKKLSLLGADLLLEALPRYLSGELIPAPQPGEGATYAPRLAREDGRLDFTRSALELERCVRAYDPWPGAWLEWKGAPLKILHARVSEVGSTSPGLRLTISGNPALGTGNGTLILEEVQPAGKKVMAGKAFLLGARDW